MDSISIVCGCGNLVLRCVNVLDGSVGLIGSVGVLWDRYSEGKWFMVVICERVCL